MTDVVHIQFVYVSASIAVFNLAIKHQCVNKYIHWHCKITGWEFCYTNYYPYLCDKIKIKL